MTPLILLAHGSRDQAWNEHLRQMTRSLRQTCVKEIALAFMDLAEPDLDAVIGPYARQGVRHAAVLPLFLAEAGHVTKDVPKIAQAAEEKYPGFAIEILPALGTHPVFLEALEKIIAAL